MAFEPDERTAALLHNSGIPAQLDGIRDAVNRFDQAMLASAETAMPGDISRLLHNIDGIPFRLDAARPELVTDSALARILDALKLIDGELKIYLANGNTAHLAHALGTGSQNLYQVLRHCLGYWQLGKDPARPATIKRLSLQLGTSDTGGVRGRVLKILVDGIEGLAAVGGRRYTGFPPADILGPDAPLLPAEPARHVPLYIESGGGDPAGCIAALIHTWGDGVAWSDFRRFESVYGPASQPDPVDGSPLGIPQVFDGGQYRAEVQRASAAWRASRPRAN